MLNFKAILIAGLILVGCSSSSSDSKSGTQATGAGHCDDKCLKACAADADCDTSKGELCCDLGADGKACADASKCPRFCANDAKCDTASGEACLRVTLASTQSLCVDPSTVDALKLCKTDKDCDTDTVCCGIYKEPLCLKPKDCPKACSTGGDCNSQNGEVCCTTLKVTDPTLAAAGLCVDPAQVNCPKACTKSTDCDTKSGQVCCNGLCNKDCVKSCTTSSDCTGQVCCTAAAENSPWVTGAVKPGYPVASGTTGAAGSGAGGSGAGGSGTGAGDSGTGAGGSGATGGGAAACGTCSQSLSDGTTACTGKSATVFQSLLACTCQTGCTTACADLCGGGTDDTACDTCVTTTCAAELSACEAD